MYKVETWKRELQLQSIQKTVFTSLVGISNLLQKKGIDLKQHFYHSYIYFMFIDLVIPFG